MLIKLRTIMAGSHGTHQPGSIVDLPAAMAEHLLATHQAEPVTGAASAADIADEFEEAAEPPEDLDTDDAATASVADEFETAETPPALETAVRKPSRGKKPKPPKPSPASQETPHE